ENRDLVAGPWRLAEIESNDTPLPGQLDLFDLLERLDTALNLRRLGGARGEALEKALSLREHRLLPRIRRLSIGLADGAFALVEVVVARIDRNLAVIDFSDFRDHAVHELA